MVHSHIDANVDLHALNCFKFSYIIRDDISSIQQSIKQEDRFHCWPPLVGLTEVLPYHAKWHDALGMTIMKYVCIYLE